MRMKITFDGLDTEQLRGVLVATAQAGRHMETTVGCDGSKFKASTPAMPELHAMAFLESMGNQPGLSPLLQGVLVQGQPAEDQADEVLRP